MAEENDLLSQLEKKGRIYHYHPKQIIYLQEDVSDSFYFIRKGRVRIFLVNREGKDITIDVLGEGRVFGESSYLNRVPRMTSVEAINDVELIGCNLEELQPYFAESSPLVEQVVKIMSQTIRNLSYQVRRLSFLQADERIAAFLLEMTDNPHESLGITHTLLPYSHQEIAECTCLQRVTVTRQLKKFQEYGWIKTGYKEVRILNREALTQFAYKSM